MTQNPYLSVIIPAYNEAKNLEGNKLDQVYFYLKTRKYSFELLLVNDGSNDMTLDKLVNFSHDKGEVVVIDNPHQGKAITVKTGMIRATGEVRLFTDLDQSTPIGEIEKLLPFIDKGYEVVIGSREVAGAKRENEPLHRHLMGKGFNMVVRIFTVWGIMDTQCGFKILSEKATKDLFNRLKITTKPKKGAFTGAFDVELLFLAKRRGYKIAEVPVEWKHVSSNRVNPIKDSIRMFSEVLRIRITDIMGGYA